jgi:hypothetical protein
MASQQIRQKYRTLAQLVSRLPEARQSSSRKELREGFRKPLASGESLEDRIKVAEERVSFLRILTPKGGPNNQSGRWIYRDGKRVEGETATKRDANGRIVSNWDGKNLDPESVKRHNQQLKRAGFLNNAHAKGIF